MTPSDASEYAWNPPTTVSLTEPSPNLGLITDEHCHPSHYTGWSKFKILCEFHD